MIKFIYNLKCSLKNMIRNKYTNSIIIVCFSLGMLLTAFILSYGNGLIDSIDNSKQNDLNHILMLNPSLEKGYKLINSKGINEIVSSNNGVELICRVVLKDELLTINNKYILNAHLAYTDSNLINIYPRFVEKGSWFHSTDVNKNTGCIIGNGLAARLFKNSNAVGKRINVNGIYYNVIGITNNYYYKDTVVLSIDESKNSIDAESLPTYYLRFSSNADLSKIREFIQNRFGEYVTKFVKDDYLNRKKQITRIITVTVLITGIVTLYSFCNIVNIVLNKVNESKKKMAVILALGGQIKDIYFQTFLELFLLNIISLIIDFGLIYFGKSVIFANLLELKINVSIFLTLSLISIIISIFLSFLAIKKISKIQIAKIIK